MDTTEKTELIILSEISRISNSTSGLAEKLRRIVEAITRGMGKDGASIFLIDRSGKTVTLVAAIGLNQESIGKLSFPLGMGIAGWVAQQKVPLALEDPYSDPRFAYVPGSGIENFKSLVAAPIMDDDSCLGVIFVLSSPIWQATSSDITLLTTTANQLSGVIKNAQLFQGLQDRLANLASIYEIGMALTSTLDVEQILSLIAKGATQFCTLKAAQSGSETCQRSFRTRLSRSTALSAMLSGNWTPGSVMQWPTGLQVRKNRYLSRTSVETGPSEWKTFQTPFSVCRSCFVKK